MAIDFSKSAGVKQFENTKKVEQEKAQVITLQNIRAENLIDNPKNGEDITMTADLEESMKQNGFTDPLEVTDFGMEPGKYMILSGHRRRASGVKVFGEDFVFPCLVRHFKTAQEVQNYTLMANNQRDSAKDPCLFAIRYRMHEDYLKSISFKGSKREEIAKRLGLSVQQVDRYKAMNKVILPVWDMVRAEQVGMSSVIPMAAISEEEQTDVYNIMQEALRKDVSLTRETVKEIVDRYKDGKRSWAEIADLPRDSGLPLNGFVNTDPGETREPKEHDRGDEGYTGNDPIAEAYDGIEEDKNRWEQEQAEATAQGSTEDGSSEKNEKEEKHELTEEEKQLKMGADIEKDLHKLETKLGSLWAASDEERAKMLVLNMSSLAQVLIDEMFRISEQWEMAEEFDHELSDLTNVVKQYGSK